MNIHLCHKLKNILNNQTHQCILICTYQYLITITRHLHLSIYQSSSPPSPIPDSSRSSKDLEANLVAQDTASVVSNAKVNHAPRSSCSLLRGATSAIELAARRAKVVSPKSLGWWEIFEASKRENTWKLDNDKVQLCKLSEKTSQKCGDRKSYSRILKVEAAAFWGKKHLRGMVRKETRNLRQLVGKWGIWEHKNYLNGSQSDFDGPPQKNQSWQSKMVRNHTHTKKKTPTHSMLAPTAVNSCQGTVQLCSNTQRPNHWKDPR